MSNFLKLLVLALAGCFASAYSIGQDSQIESDNGARGILSLAGNELSKTLAKLENDLPDNLKRQILKDALEKAWMLRWEERMNAFFEVAGNYRRYRMFDEAIELFDLIAQEGQSNRLKIKALRAKAELEFVASKNLTSAISAAEQALAIARFNKLPEDAAEVLIEMGSYYFINEQPEKMIEAYDEFNELPESVKDMFSREHLKANLYIGRALMAAGDPKAVQYFDRIEPIIDGDPEAFELDLVLSIMLELPGKQFQWNDPARIAKLQKFFLNERFANDPKILDVGNHIFWAYFLDRENEWVRFMEFGKAFKKRLQEFPDDLKTVESRELSNLEQESVTQITVQTTAALAFALYDKKVEFPVLKWRAEVADLLSEEVKLEGKFPSRIARHDLNTFVDSIRKGVLDVLKCEPIKRSSARRK